MIQLFEARKKQKLQDNELLEKYLQISKKNKTEVLKEYKTSEMVFLKKRVRNYLRKMEQM